MGNWATNLYTQGMEKKIIPLFIREIEGYTGFNGDFNINYRSPYLFWRGPVTEIYNIDKPHGLRTKIKMPIPESSTGCTFDVFMYLWGLAEELLHDIDYRTIPLEDFHRLLPEKHSSGNHSRIALRTLDLTIRFMREYYPEFYMQERVYFKRLKMTLRHTNVD